MTTLNSRTTLAELQAAYADNAGYLESLDATKAARFITACRLLLLRLPKRINRGAAIGEIELDPAVLQAELLKAERWLAANSPGMAGQAGFVRHSDFSEFRG